MSNIRIFCDWNSLKLYGYMLLSCCFLTIQTRHLKYNIRLCLFMLSLFMHHIVLYFKTNKMINRLEDNRLYFYCKSVISIYLVIFIYSTFIDPIKRIVLYLNFLLFYGTSDWKASRFSLLEMMFFSCPL